MIAVSRYFTALMMIFTFVVPRVEADETADPGDAFPLPEIVVTAARAEAPPSLILRQLTNEDIEAWNAQTLADAIVNAPGVNMLYGGTSGDAKFWIRGFRDRDVLLLFDGIPIAQNFEGNFDLNELPMQNISRINVLKSAPSVIYGPNGMGGVIDVVPESPASGADLSASLEAGSDERRVARGTLSLGGENHSFSLSAQHQEADDYALSDGYDAELNQPDGDRVNSDFERDSALLYGSVRSALLGTTTLFANYTTAERGLPVEAGVDDPDYERLNKSERQTIGLSNQFKAWPISFKVYHNQYDSELAIYNDDQFNRVDEIESSNEDSYGASLYVSLDTSENNSLVLSGSWKHDEFKADGVLEAGDKAELTTWTVAAENQYWINERLSLAAGVMFVSFKPEPTGDTSEEVSPQASMSWQVTPALRVHASAAQRVRFPKMRELYRRRWGNPDLDPQTARNYELGVSYVSRYGLAGDFSVYRSVIDDLIERPDRRAIYSNLDEVTLQGIETAASGWLGERLFLRLAYTYLDAEEDLEDGGSRQLRSRPEHTLQAEIRYRFPGGALFALNGIHVNGLHDLDPEGDYVELSSYFVANAKMSLPLGKNHQVYLSVANIGDTNYQHRYGFPREGQSIAVGLNLSF
jgi:iron complex outermembrane receptor protein